MQKLKIIWNLFSRRGFTLIEVLVYVTIFAATGTFLVSILSTILNIETKQSSQNQLGEQLVFLSDTIKRMIQESSLVDIPTSTATSSLRLRMRASADDPTRFFSSGTTLYFQQGSGGTLIPLTDSSVKLDFVTFRRYQSLGGPDVVEVSLALSNNVTNPRALNTRTLKTAVTHLYAATFDSDLLPDASTRKLGQNSATTWQRIYVLDGDASLPAFTFGGANDVGIFRATSSDVLGFSTNGFERMRIDASGNIGIGSAAPTQKLEVTGEVLFSGISSDGAGKVVCVKTGGTLGTCGNQPNASGVCTVCN